MLDTEQTGVGINHPNWTKWLVRWRRMRDLADGVDAVMAHDGSGRAEDSYLGRPAQFDNEYMWRRYQKNAVLIEAIAPTRDLMTARLFKAPAEIETAKELEQGPLNSVAQKVAKEIAEVGRVGVFVNWDAEASEPCYVLYKTEQIVNWFARKDGSFSLVVLEQVVRKESDDIFSHEKTRERIVLLLENGVHVQYTYQYQGTDEDQGSADWKLIDETTPLIQDRTMDFIPFYVFNTGVDDSSEIERPLLEPMAMTVIQAYNTSAWYRNALRLTGCPTPYASAEWEEEDEVTKDVICDDCGTKSPIEMWGNECGKCGCATHSACGSNDELNIKLGSETMVMLPPNGTLGFMEITGGGLNFLKDQLKDLMEQISAHGARMLRMQISSNRNTATGEKIFAEVDSVKTESLASNINVGMTKVMVMAAKIKGVIESKHDSLSFQLKPPNVADRLSFQEVIAYAAAWANRQLPLSVVLMQFKMAGLVDEKTDEIKYLEDIEKFRPPESFGDDLDDEDDDTPEA